MKGFACGTSEMMPVQAPLAGAVQFRWGLVCWPKSRVFKYTAPGLLDSAAVATCNHAQPAPGRDRVIAPVTRRHKKALAAAVPVINDADRLSALPGDVLRKIVGLLPAQEAVQTSVLARA
ncbi:hypothetical protein PR202_ga24622 [Eleusine coracana subsp. coracana]|uniref:F-box domain-containing protein n=1 Tax=Eleusine coracana subsp. coracana TaxID=191504 RepID=A0AAV5D7E6_ELECO|nr:hypothetical protein PR202_ga24622 [Eleusine coracana subsp. coracana]